MSAENGSLQNSSPSIHCPACRISQANPKFVAFNANEKYHTTETPFFLCISNTIIEWALPCKLTYATQVGPSEGASEKGRLAIEGSGICNEKAKEE